MQAARSPAAAGRRRTSSRSRTRASLDDCRKRARAASAARRRPSGPRRWCRRSLRARARSRAGAASRHNDGAADRARAGRPRRPCAAVVVEAVAVPRGETPALGPAITTAAQSAGTSSSSRLIALGPVVRRRERRGKRRETAGPVSASPRSPCPVTKQTSRSRSDRRLQDGRDERLFVGVLDLPELVAGDDDDRAELDDAVARGELRDRDRHRRTRRECGASRARTRAGAASTRGSDGAAELPQGDRRLEPLQQARVSRR